MNTGQYQDDILGFDFSPSLKKNTLGDVLAGLSKKKKKDGPDEMENVFEGLQKRHSGAPKHGMLKRGVTSNKISSLMNQAIKEKLMPSRDNSESSVSLMSSVPTPSPPKHTHKRMNSSNDIKLIGMN